jgi:membrane peptidoglycan carboxypeptidase
MALDAPVRSPSASSSSARRSPGRARRRGWRRALAIVGGLLGVAVVGGALLLLLTPSAESAPARVQAILAAHGAPSDDGVVPPKVAAALLATEDSRYESDWAVDPRGAARALWGLITHNPNEGGATIEVQLAKMLWTPGRSDPLALAEQVALAVKLDHDFSKTRILAMYLDAAYFGDGAYGVTAAAEHYFGLLPEQLNWGQASLLAGLVQAPTSYDPHGHLSAALARRQHVLDRMVATGVFTQAQASAVAAEPLDPAIPFYG